MYTNDIVRLKEHTNGSLWNLKQMKEYIVEDTKYGNKSTGEQSMLVIRNEKGKKRKYYEHLFEKVKISELVIPSLILGCDTRENIKKLLETWIKYQWDTEENRNAYKKLKEIEEEWELTIPKLNDKIKFNQGIGKVKYQDRKFTIKKIINSSFFEKIILLKEIKGSFKLSEMEKCDE